MATPQELQNALMLKKANPNLTTEQVVNQSRVPVTPTSQINQDQLAKNQANRQAQIATGEVPAVGQQPAPIVNAPVDPNTGLSKPLEPTSTPTAPIQAEVKAPEPIKTEVASSTAKIEPVIDYNVSAGREGEIQDNIAKITQTNPNLLKDRNAYNQAFGYETADAGKKALLDSTFSGQVKPSQDDIFNSMRSGVSVGDPKSTEFRQAQARINTFNKYSVYDTASLATSLQSGDLLVGTKAYNDLVSDPTMALKIQKAQAFNKGVVDLVKTGETQMANVLAQNPTVAQALEDGNLSKAEYDQLTNNAEVSAQGKLVETNKTKYETIKAQYDAVEDDVDSEYAGKEVTDSFKAKIVADRRKGMYKDYQIASLEYQNSLGTYTNLKADSTALLAQNMELYKTEQANKAEIAKEERAMQRSKDALQYEADFNKNQAEQALNDPATAIKSVMDEMAKIGVSSTESLQTKIQKAKDYIANGGTIGEYVDEMKRLYTEKPEYKAYLAKQGGTEWQSTNITRYNPATGANESTPVFYRKKTDGSFEAVDLSGNKIDSSVLTGGGITTGGVSSTGDMSSLASTYPYEASFKNNNTSGITWGMSANTKKLLENAGIKISEGTARPSREGGKYVKFDNIADGLLAHKILLSQAGSDDINARLQQWVGTKEGPTYAKNLMDQAGIKAGTKFSQLTPEQLDKLVMVQVKKESPGMYKELTKGTTENKTQTVQGNPLQVKEFEAYNGTTIPAQYKTPLEQDDFVKRYNEWRASRPGKKIETGNDILNIRLDKGGTEGEKISQSYTSRMLNAVNNLIPLEKKFIELSTGGQVAQTYLPSLLKSSDQKMMDAEKKNFITAVLRKQSGASIAPSEFAGEEMKYFPQPGDSKDVVIAKQNARNAEIKAMLATAGTDAEGNSLSTYYNPPVITNETKTTTTPVKKDKISTLKKNYFPQ